METLALSQSPRSAARQMMVFLINSQRDARDSKETSKDDTPETSPEKCQSEQCTPDAKKTPDRSDCK